MIYYIPANSANLHNSTIIFELAKRKEGIAYDLIANDTCNVYNQRRKTHECKQTIEYADFKRRGNSCAAQKAKFAG
ncbi:hypothetical protein F230042K4_07120 [Mediterraneibacter glycyrrhizinilyticus]